MKTKFLPFCATIFVPWSRLKTILLCILLAMPLVFFTQTFSPPTFPFPPGVPAFTPTPISVSCGGYFPSGIPSPFAANCISTSPDYTNKYSKQSFYVPTTNDPVITVNLTFHVFNDAMGNGSWDANPMSQSFADLTSLKNGLTNWYDRYSDPRSANYTVSGFTPPVWIQDSRVNYVVTNIYFYNNTSMNTANNGGTLLNYVYSMYPNRVTEGLPILFNNGNLGATGYAGGWSGAPYVHTSVVVPPHGIWFAFAHLWHEIGHCFSLMHTYGPSSASCCSDLDGAIDPNTACPNSDFLSDVFPINNPLCPTNPVAPCTACYENFNNVPNPISSNNLMADPKYTPGWPWMSPLQMGRRIRNLHLPSNGIRSFAKDMQSDHLNPWYITSNETWDFDIQMYHDIVVKSGNTLTIKCKVGMPLDSRIVVEKGAKLLIDGGEIFGWCKSGVWSGIEIQGTYNKSQAYSGGYATFQGIVELLNGAKISDAANGITTGVNDAFGNFDWTSMGGVVSAKDAIFSNNIRDVQFLAYSAPNNKSAFVNCKFITNTSIKGGFAPSAHVTLWEVQNVKFLGCEFNYNAGSAYPLGSRGTGIGSADAKYNVTSWCTSSTLPCLSTQRGAFYNLDGGIVANNTNPLRTISVSECDFSRNYNDGAWFSGVDYVTFVNNTIDVGTNPGSFNPSGLYLNTCKYYSVQNNTITTTSLPGNAIGIYTDLSAAGAHTIYRNTIDNLLVGVCPQRDNSGPNNYITGLKIKCNDFASNIANNFDVAVVGSGNSVAYYQGISAVGQPSLLVGNKYKATCGGSERWWMDPTSQTVLHANHTDAYARVTPQPSCSDAAYVSAVNSSMPYSNSHCPNNYTTTNSTSLNSNISSAKINLNSITNDYNSLIDGGNTQSLLNLINSNASEGDIKNGLVAASPYLSDPVLITYFSRTNTTPGHIKDIHGLNNPVTKTVWDVIVDRNLPEGIEKQMINLQQTDEKLSERQILEGKLAEASFNLELAYSEKVRYYLNDSTPGSLDSALTTIGLGRLADWECQLIASKVALENNIITANDIDIAHGGSVNVDESCQFQKLMIELNGTPEKAFSLRTNTLLKQQFEKIAEDLSNKACYQAQAILNLVFNNHYVILRLIPPINSGSRFLNNNSGEDASSSIELPNNQALQFYPNPTNGNVNVLIKGSINQKDSYLFELKNMFGQILMSKTIEANRIEQINLTDFPNSIYVVSLKQNDKLIKESKLVIMK